MKKIIAPLCLSLILCCCIGAKTSANPTDIVPRGSALLDAFASLAAADAFGASDTPEDFLGEPLYTRGQLAHLLEHLVQDEPQKLARIQQDDSENATLQAAIAGLRPELTLDSVDLSEAEATPAHGASISGYVQPEARVRIGGDQKPGSGALGVYRATAQGHLRSNLSYVLSASNWPEDDRRVFQNDVGPHDFSAVNEAYLEVDGGRRLTVDIGRKFNRWGPGMRGAAMLGDNAPAMDQIHVAFPFSLGAKLGRNYSYEQLISTFKANDKRDYFVARRVEYAFSQQWLADIQESYVTDRSWGLEFAPFPDYYNIKNSHLFGLRQQSTSLDIKNAINLTASYTTPSDSLRLYGQFQLQDLRTPGANSGITPRKSSYLVGGSLRPVSGTRLTLEYLFDDPTTYSSINYGTQWQEGRYDEIAFPSGPNATEVYARIDQHLGTKLTVSLEGRDRRRHDLSFPAPTARDLAAIASYALGRHNALQVTFHDYRQDPFPISPDVPVGNNLQPSNAEGNYGQFLRIRQLDVAYRFFF